MEKVKYHNTDPYLINGQHRITVTIVGAGGTGSLILTKICRLHQALNHLDHPGFFVTLIDDDVVEEQNVGRQMFTLSDVGYHKSEVLITKVNHAFGLDWECKKRKYNYKEDFNTNITIGAVDNVKARKEMVKGLYYKDNKSIKHRIRFPDTEKPYYLIVCGNARDFGQVILSDRKKELKNIFDIFGDDFRKYSGKKTQGEGCSYWDKLQEQDLFINDWVSMYAIVIIKDMLFKKRIDYQGFFFNTSEYETQKMSI